ncbi:hypothetical protein CDN99_25840 [Roseateles aquatilis]|uniref:Big-1 domain-containing protein n=1 Tax=Roseateles aquatilis TaxID=431061 RepID=A0A246ITK2_9BURK|nr:Ig-like domain-containing protein [Roseateles aquatilis]OWQ83558.1 hypothetical protein CDN99_25840 [Roseateles aquatilis]
MTFFSKYARFIRTATIGAFVAGTLAACGGGGGNAGTPANGGGGGTTPTTVADLSVVLDRSTVSNSGADTVKVTVTAVDANRAAVGNVPVTFGVDSNAVITPGGTKTDATTGQVTATVSIGADRTNRTITLTVATGSIVKKTTFDVVDSVTGGKVADLSLVLGSASIVNDGSQTGKLTVTSLDANRTAIGGSPVVFAVQDPAGTAFVTAGGVTDASTGQLIATVAIGANHTSRTITITASSGSVSRTVGVNIVPPVTTTPTANDMTLVLDKISIGNTGSDRVTATVTAVDSQRNVVPGIIVAFKVDNGATVAVLNATTNAQGQAVATVTSGADRSNRLITVTATSDTLVRTATFQVTGAKVQGTAVPTLPVAGSTGNRVEFRVSDVNQNPMTFQAITVTAPGLPPASGATDANGAFVYTYTAPTTAGPIDITAVSGGVSGVVTVTVPSSSSTVPPAAAVVVSASLSASPTVVSVNTDVTNNRAELRAIFLAANNAPVKNVRVRFDLNGDVNSIGGTISAGTQLVYSDTNGNAVSNYSPGNRASPTSGVTIRACWDYNDFAAGTCPNAVLTTLTVVSDPLSVSIGTNEEIDVTNPLTYKKKFVILVVDAAGQPKGDVQITPSLDLIGYFKGHWDPVGTVFKQFYDLDTLGNSFPWSLTAPAMCQAEDLNKNGAIDSNEDRNGNGQLDPRKSDASISMSGSTRTDASGQAVLVLEYPRSVAGWVAFSINASAFGVLSPPAVYSGVLPYPGAIVNQVTIDPAFRYSPYGLIRKSTDGAFCTNAN